MMAMTPVNGIRPTPTYAMPPEYTNNNYLTGTPGMFNNNAQNLQGTPGALNSDFEMLQGEYGNTQAPEGPTAGGFNSDLHTPQGAFHNAQMLQGPFLGAIDDNKQVSQGPSHNFNSTQSSLCAGNTVFSDRSAFSGITEVPMGSCDAAVSGQYGGSDTVTQGAANCVPLTNNAGTGQSANFTGSQVPSSLTIGGGNFTFTSPTQSIYYSPAITSYTGTRYMQPRTMPQAFAPTSCLQWQHSIPQRIPWSACGPSAREQDILKFTGDGCSASAVTFTNEYMPVCSISQQFSPIPSCSHPPRRLKRSAPESLSNPPFSSKVHLTEAMISKHMQGLQIKNGASKPAEEGLNGSEAMTNSSASHRQQHWQNFQDLEDRLSVSDEEEETNTDAGQPRLHIVEDIAKMVKSQPVIPKEIMDKMTSPRMELVLWQPPGGVIKDIIDATKSSSQAADSYNTNEPKGVEEVQSMQGIGMPSVPSTESMEEDGIMDIDSSDVDFSIDCS